MSHTRHYYPDSTTRSGAPSTDRTLDAFAALSPDEPLHIIWALDLPDPELKALDQLVRHLPYLGRADSICTASLDTRPPRQGPGYTEWAAAVESPAHLTSTPDPDGERTMALLSPHGPLDLDALVQRPIDWRARKLLYPRGTRQISYSSTSTKARHRPLAVNDRLPKVVRLKLGGPVRPPQTATVALTDVFHRACAKILNKVREGHPREFSNLVGKSDDGKPLTEHRHSHFLATTDETRRISEIILWTPGGLAPDEYAAITKISHLWDGSPHPGFKGRIPLLLNGRGSESLLPEEWTVPATRWRSRTPYLPTGHPKGEPLQFALKRLRRDLGNLAPDLAEFLIDVSPSLDADSRAQDVDPRQYDRRRASDRTQRRQPPSAHHLTLTFSRPIRPADHGPLTLGQLSHYGLGHFTPIVEPPSQ